MNRSGDDLITRIVYKNRRGKPFLNNEKAAQIKRKIRDGESDADIAKEFHVSRATISGIRTGRVWSHVTIDDEAN